jgi:hypothetical protein
LHSMLSIEFSISFIIQAFRWRLPRISSFSCRNFAELALYTVGGSKARPWRFVLELKSRVCFKRVIRSRFAPQGRCRTIPWKSLESLWKD